MTATKCLFSGTKIACMRGGRVLFQNLSFDLNPGDVAHVAGPNGAGKTSFLRLLSGILAPAKGRIRWEGHDFLKDGRDAHAARTAFLPAGEQGLKPHDTVEETLRFWLACLPGTKAEGDAIGNALEKMNIGNLRDTPVRLLSSGQRRRLSFARVLLRPARLWLLDEPLNGLDYDSCGLFDDALDAHSKEGGIALLASHYAVTPPKHGKMHRITLGGAP